METIELSVKGIALDKETHLPILLLVEADGHRVLPVPIGPFEASAIIIRLEDIEPPRPITHDLLADFMVRHGFAIQAVEIYGYMGDKLLARIRYRRRLRKFKVEARPSDAIALALRQDAPIFCVPELLAGANANEDRWEEMDPGEGQFLYLGSEGGDGTA
jgi:bifunctional DNase/RNase